MNTKETLRLLERSRNDLNTIFDDGNLTETEMLELHNSFASINAVMAKIRSRENQFLKVTD